MKNFTTNLSNALTNKGFKRVEIKEVIRNNNLQLHAVLLFEKGDEKVTPSIYIDDFYTDYQNGRSYESIVDAIIKIYKGCHPTFTVEDVFSNMKKKENFYIMVVNAKTNNLDEYIHRKFLDDELAEIVISKFELNGSAYTRLLKSQFPYDVVSNEEELFEIAYENTKRQITYEPLQNVIKEILINHIKYHFLSNYDDFISKELLEYLEESIISIVENSIGEMRDEEPMIVVSNHQKNFGASALINADLLKEVSEKYFNGKDMYIIPSSIHECLCVKKSDDKCGQYELIEMVKSVNSTEVREDEILSDKIFVFNTTTKKLNIAK